jgi:tRNA-dihydrouridine synthase B
MTLSTALYHPVAIGNIVIPGNLFLAPLAGYTDRAFRSLCLCRGASFTYSEMVSAEGIARKSHNTEALMIRAEGEDLFSIQIFMPDASVTARCLPRLLSFKPTVIDINCGCPVPKVVKTGAGSSLMRNPQIIHDIVRVLKDGCAIPVSVKIRTGWDAESINYRETADAAVSAGADMITMHARTKAMGYTGTADWSKLADLKSYIMQRTAESGRFPVAVFGSGDLFSAQAAKKMLEETLVDGVMFARGAIGNPFIFRDTIQLLTNGSQYHPTGLHDRVEAMREQLLLLCQDKGERLACKEMRKHASAFIKGIPHAAQAKQHLVRCERIADYEVVFAQLLEVDTSSL